MNRIDQTKEELKSELEIQVRFLISSCLAFDNGNHSEAKRISGILRTLLKDKGQSKSLLGQLGIKNEFLSYYYKTEGTFSTQNNFIVSTLTGNSLHQFSPNFTTNIPKVSLTFDDWWKQEVIIDSNDNMFSRELIVLSVAESDGGAHVDPGLEQKYYMLARKNSQQSFFLEGDFSEGPPAKLPIEDLKPGDPPVWHTLRQIAHEVIESITLSFTYGYEPKEFYQGIGFTGFIFH